MALAQHRLADGQGLLVEGLGGGVVPRLEQQRQVVQAGGGVGVALAQRRLADGQGLLEEGLGGGVVPLRSSSTARLFRLLAVRGWRSPSTALWIARACSRRGLAAA